MKRRIQPHELLRKVKRIGLLLNRPRLNIVIVIQHGNIGMNRRTQTRLLRDIMHEFLHFAVFTTGFIVNIKDTEAKLLRAAIHTAPAEKQHIVTTARHRLIRPELSLLRTWQIADVVVTLRTHELLDNPEILLLQPAYVVQRHGDFGGLERLF